MSDAWTIPRVPSSEKARLFYSRAEFRRWKRELEREGGSIFAPAEEFVATPLPEPSEPALQAEAAPPRRQPEAARAAPRVGNKGKLAQVSPLLSSTPNQKPVCDEMKGGKCCPNVKPADRGDSAAPKEPKGVE